MCSEVLYISTELMALILLRCIKREVVLISQAFSRETNLFCISYIKFTTAVILNYAALQSLNCLWDRQEGLAVCMSWSLLQHHLRACPSCTHCSRHCPGICLGLHLLLYSCLWSATHGSNNLLRRWIFLKQWNICGSSNIQFLLLLNTKHYKPGQFYYHHHFTGGKQRHRAGICPKPLAHFVC